MVFTQDVDFAIRAMLHLREGKVRDDPADRCEVPSCGVEHLRSEIDHRDLGNIVGGTTDTSAQSAKTDE